MVESLQSVNSNSGKGRFYFATPLLGGGSDFTVEKDYKVISWFFFFKQKNQPLELIHSDEYPSMYSSWENIYFSWKYMLYLKTFLKSLFGIISLSATKFLFVLDQKNYPILSSKLYLFVVSLNQSTWEGKETILKNKSKTKKTIFKADMTFLYTVRFWVTALRLGFGNINWFVL